MINQEIEEDLRNSINKIGPFSSEMVGLMNGKAGHILLCAYLYKLEQQEYWFDKYSILIDECIDTIINYSIGNKLSNGITGFLWTLQHLNRLHLIEKEAVDSLYTLEEIVMDSIEDDLVIQNYDLLSGLIGKGMYFLEKPEFSLIDHSRIEYIISLIEHWAIPADRGRTWQYQHPEELQEERYNLGMAHGVPSIIAFLSKVYRKGISQKIIRPLLLDAVEWLLSQEKLTGHSRFSEISNVVHDSRLAWCYGDLGPCLALWHASKALDVNDWKNKALAIAIQATQRPIITSGVIQNVDQHCFDSGFCHGTCGLAHIFYRFYQASGLTAFQAASNYWLSINSHFDSFLFPNPTYRQQELSNNWQVNSSLLKGLIGKSLVYLTIKNNNKEFTWDGIFMTDIHI